MAFSPIEFMEILNSPRLFKGHMIILEESGIQLDARQAMTKDNRWLSHVLESFRSMNTGLIMNLPHIKMLDKNARSVMHTHIETVSINRMDNKCIIKWLNHSISRHGKIYQKYPVKFKNRRPITLSKLRIGLPSESLRLAYEKKKGKFVRGQNKRILEAMKARSVKKTKADKVFDAKGYALKCKKLGFTTTAEIRAEFGLSEDKGRLVRALLKKKGGK